MAWDDVPWEFGKTTETTSLIQTREDTRTTEPECEHGLYTGILRRVKVNSRQKHQGRVHDAVDKASLAKSTRCYSRDVIHRPGTKVSSSGTHSIVSGGRSEALTAHLPRAEVPRVMQCRRQMHS